MTIKSMFGKQDLQPVYSGNSDFVALPFPHLRLTWNNGDPREKQGAKLYGGWQAGSEQAREDMDTLNFATMPSMFVEDEWVGRQGNTYNAFSSRWVYAAPIVAKDDWWEELDPQKNKVVKRHRLDFLVYLGHLNDKKEVVPYAPGILYKTGFAASAIVKAFKEFVKMTEKAREEFAPGVPDAFFYVPIGTFGDKRITAPAGPSTYVPCQIQPFEAVGEKTLQMLFVGDEIAGEMIRLQAEAMDWLADTHANRSEGFEPQASPYDDDPTPSQDQLPPE